MDAVIHFCFGVDPEKLTMDEYAKYYGKAKYVWDYIGLVEAKKAINLMA